jgi:Zn-dependent protease with chaperone function
MTVVAPVRGHNIGPAGTTSLFALLIAAVTATSSIQFLSVRETFLFLDLTRREAVGWGLLAVFGVAGVLYVVAPWWIQRRRRLRRIDIGNSPDLMADLQRLCEVARVRPPVFLLAPRRRSTQAVAFGHAGRHCVQINAGLVKASVSAPAVFRAVVLHEMAHLWHRDVDITMWTVAIWRAFTVTALPLMVAMTSLSIVVGDGGLAANVRSVVPNTVSFVVLTLLVFLTRNAILRLREHHADILSADWESTEGTLDPAARSALTGLFEEANVRDRGRFALVNLLRAKHPEPSARTTVLDNPIQVSRPKPGQLFGVGVAAAVCLENNSIFLFVALPGFSGLADMTNALFVASFLCLTLVFAVFRAQMLGERSPLRTLTYPLVLMLGFLVGDAVALVNTAGDGWRLLGFTRGAPSAADVMVSIFPLVIGALLVTAWARSVAAGVSLHARRTWYLVAAVVTVSATPWLALWFVLRGGRTSMSVRELLGRPALSVTPLPGTAHRWYADVVEFVQVITLWPRQQVFFVASWSHPWVVLGILLTAVVPLLLARRLSRRGVRFGVAGAAICVLCFGLHFAEIHSVYRPESGNEGIDEWMRSSADVFLAMTVAVAALVAAAVMAVPGRMRVVHAVASVCITSTMGTLIMMFGSAPGFCGAFLSIGCWRPVDPVTSGDFWHFSVVLGIIAAIPAMIIGRCTGHLLRLRPTERQLGPTVRFRTVRQVLVGVTLVGTLTAAATFNHANWVTLAADRVPDPKTNCLLGRWRETSHRSFLPIDSDNASSLVAELQRGGVIHEFRSDGTAVIDFGAATVESAVAVVASPKSDRMVIPADDKVLRLVHHGAVVLRFHDHNGLIYYGRPNSGAWYDVVIGDKTSPERHAPMVPRKETAQCSEDSLKLTQPDGFGNTNETILTRLS